MRLKSTPSLFLCYSHFKNVLLVLWLIVMCLPAKAQFYNGTQTTFGKNRVQYIDFLWNFYRFEHYDTYFYLGGQELASYVGQTAEHELIDLQKSLDYKLDGRLQFMIYNKLSDLKQSNIGLETDEQFNIGGQTKIIGNKIFLYYPGNHEAFRLQIRMAVAHILVAQIMYGGDIKERVQNAVSLTLPDWYINGLVSYIGTSWSVDIDNRMRDGIISKRYKKFNRLTGEDALIAGHSIWYYIAETYGPATVPNLLYMTRSGRDIESGFLIVLGVSLKTLTENWYAYFEKRYADAEVGRNILKGTPVVKRPKATRIYSQLKASPEGGYVAYTTNEIGRYKVVLQNLSTKSRKVIMRGGYRSIVQKADESYPLLAWHPTGKILSVIREYKGQLLMTTYTLENKEKETNTILNFEKILDFSYSDDGQSIVMSAVKKGETDIYVFNLRSRTAEQITRDAYDDINPHFINHSKAIIFSSNRPSDTLFVEKLDTVVAPAAYDLFVYNYKNKGYILQRLTNTKTANETQPMPYDSRHIGYLSDENGITNRYIARADSMVSAVDTAIQYRLAISTFPQTDYSRNIISQDIVPKKQTVSDIIFSNGKYRLITTPLPKASRGTKDRLDITPYRDELNKPKQAPKAFLHTEPDLFSPDEPQVNPKDSSAIDINDYFFQSEFPKSKKKKKKAVVEETVVPTRADSLGIAPPIIETQHNFTLPKQRLYEIGFSANSLVSQLDNANLFPSYQLFSGGGGYISPGLNAFVKIGTADLFEDYRFTGGFKIPFDLMNTEYFLSFENLKYRLDKQIIFHRQITTYGIPDNNNNTIGIAKATNNEGRLLLKWPFSETSSIRGGLSVRNDRVVAVATDPFTLGLGNFNRFWTSAKVEYVFDNTINPALNTTVGTRYKVFGEAFKKVYDGGADDGTKNKTTMYVVGFDVRHYERIHRDIVWANRIAGSSSFGQQKLLYYLGSIDNPLYTSSNGKYLNNFDPSTPVDPAENYAYQANASNVRGFVQNVRNGNNFLVFSSELRVPLFRYLLNRPIKSDLIRNFQVLGFGDAGTAWVGSSPYANNIFNTRVISRGDALTITITNQRDPLVYGMGFGLRSKILGYFIRTDWAWGVEDGVIQPRIFYLTFSLDF